MKKILFWHLGEYLTQRSNTWDACKKENLFTTMFMKCNANLRSQKN